MEANDYYPFGQVMPSRTYLLGSKKFRYGFNGKEKDTEVSGDDYDFGARMYDARVGRMFSIDKYTNSFSSWAPYLFAGNTPIQAIDYNGDYIYIVTKGIDANGTLVQTVTKVENMEDLKLIKGGETLIRTQTGQDVINKFIKNTEEDVYITAVVFKDPELVHEQAKGATLNPDNSVNKKCIKDGTFSLEPMKEAGKKPLEVSTWRPFEKLKLRNGAKKNYFIAIDARSDETQDKYQESENLYHEFLHVDLFNEGIDANLHHEKMGSADSDYKSPAKPNSMIELHRQELRELRKQDEEKK